MPRHTTDVPTPHPRVEEVRYAPRHAGGISLEEVAALVECASGANLRRARDARALLAARVPPEMLRQVRLARARTGWSEAEPS